MDCKGVIFKKYKPNAEAQADVSNFTITIDGDHGDYLETIKSLLNVLSLLPEGECYAHDRNYICALISEMLPSQEQVKMLFDAQVKDRVKK